MGCSAEDCRDTTGLITVTYLGVAGLMIEHEGSVLLTAPFFSNPRFGSVRPRFSRLLRRSPPTHSNGAQIERFLPQRANQAVAILVGHGHYDHLMDIPYIATRRATSAVVYGGPSVRHMLMGDSTLRANPHRVVAIDTAEAGDTVRAGRWFYTSDSAFRFLAVRARHAPTVKLWGKGYTYANGVVEADLDALPRTALNWKLGEEYSYVIDVLSRRRPVFRIYFQDAPSPPPLGFPAPAVLDERRVDLAILCAGSASNVRGAPDSLLKVLAPRAVMVTHWESFFRAQSLPMQVGRSTDLEAFTASLRRSLPSSAGWLVPLPQATVRFRPSDSR